jgi:hypothetical protein
MTKQQIFSYYSYPKYRTLCTDKSGATGNKFNILQIDIEKETINEIHNISDCQLILKPISEISEEDKVVLARYIIDSYIRFDSYCFTIAEERRFFEWLLEHSYCLNDEWFENGIAVKEGE